MPDAREKSSGHFSSSSNNATLQKDARRAESRPFTFSKNKNKESRQQTKTKIKTKIKKKKENRPMSNYKFETLKLHVG